MPVYQYFLLNKMWIVLLEKRGEVHQRENRTNKSKINWQSHGQNKKHEQKKPNKEQYTNQHSKPKSEQHVPNQKLGVVSCAPKG